MKKYSFLLIIVTFFFFNSCNSRETEKAEANKIAVAKESEKTGVPERYLVAAQEFCACHGEWLQIQYDGEIAKKNQDLAKMAELGEQLKALPDRTDCMNAVDTKMEQYEKEDGPELMEQYFDAAAKIHCPIFIQILDLAEQVQNVG